MDAVLDAEKVYDGTNGIEGGVTASKTVPGSVTTADADIPSVEASASYADVGASDSQTINLTYTITFSDEEMMDNYNLSALTMNGDPGDRTKRYHKWGHTHCQCHRHGQNYAGSCQRDN